MSMRAPQRNLSGLEGKQQPEGAPTWKPMPVWIPELNYAAQIRLKKSRLGNPHGHRLGGRCHFLTLERQVGIRIVGDIVRQLVGNRLAHIIVSLGFFLLLRLRN